MKSKRSQIKRTRKGKARTVVVVKAAKPSALMGRVPVEKLPPRKFATAGLWADGPASVFSNSRMLYTTDPTEHEQELTKTERALSPLREKNKGRVII